MLNLIRKDFIALKYSFWLCILILAFFSFAFRSMSSSIHLVAIYAGFAALNMATTIDINNNNHKFLVTLPISRKHIVQAKYMIAIMCTLFGVLGSYGTHELIKLALPGLNKPDISIIDILAPTGIILVLASIYLPLFYALSKKGTSIINVVFLVILIAMAQPTAYVIHKLNEPGFTSNLLLFVIPIGILLLYFASYFLTVFLFKRKDL